MHRRCTTVHCIGEMKKNRHSFRKDVLYLQEAMSADIRSPIHFFESYREPVKIKNGAQLEHNCVLVTDKYERIVQAPKESPF